MDSNLPRHPSANGKVLIVDDDIATVELFKEKLKLQGIDSATALTLEAALDLVSTHSYRAILLDLYLDGCNSIEVLSDFFGMAPRTKVVIFTGHGSIELAVQAVKKGASGFLIKSDPVDQNIKRFTNLICPPGAKAAPSSLEPYGIVGSSLKMKQLADKVFKFRKVDSTVLITGESGTGKELIARAIHEMSTRWERPFVAINCAAIPESILESELFGYRKGAFTGARKDRKGYFETCTEGTLFLDEVGEMPTGLQAKLLRVLQEKEVTPLGSCDAISVNTRVIAATNRRLWEEVNAQRFREDLFYRLAVFHLPLPALRERTDDIPDLVRHFVHEFNQRFGKVVHSPSSGVLARLKAHYWPGNIRELRNSVERGVAFAEGGEFATDELLPDSRIHPVAQVEEFSVDQMPLNFQQAKDSFEELYVKRLLQHSRGNVSEAARISGQYRPNVYRMIKKHRIEPQQFKGHL